MTKKQLALEFVRRIINQGSTGLISHNEKIDFGIDAQLQNELIETLLSVDSSNYLIGVQIAKGLDVKLNQPIFRLLNSIQKGHKNENFAGSTKTSAGLIQMMCEDAPLNIVSATLKIAGKKSGLLTYRKSEGIYHYYLSLSARKILIES